jgi:FMN reductase
MAEYLVIATSLRPGSHSRILAAQLVREFEVLGVSTELHDLRAHPLPMCDGGGAYGHANVAPITAKIEAARVIVLATPVYNYDANAAAKNLVELTGSAWEDKIAGFLCAAGGAMSYMSVMGLANSLMLDFRCVILPRFVYATGDDFEGDRITNADTTKRVAELAAVAVRFGRATLNP